MEITAEDLPDLLRNDNAVKLAGVDVDGQLRGKLVSKKKFMSIATDGFGFCSVIFGWDMHDMTYMQELKVSNKENGYRDIIAVPDLQSFRRIPWENNIPFFLVGFYDPDTKEPVPACPRGLLGTQLKKLGVKGFGAMAGGELPSTPHLTPRHRKPPVADRMIRSRVRVLPVQDPACAINQRAVYRRIPQRERPPIPPIPYRGHVWLQPDADGPQPRLFLRRIQHVRGFQVQH
jgi:hypothetical protein